MVLALEELEECIASNENVEQAYAKKELLAAYKRFIEKLPVMERRVFLCRYWYCDTISDICRRFGYGNSKVKMMLLRTRGKLLLYLEKEGVFVAE